MIRLQRQREAGALMGTDSPVWEEEEPAADEGTPTDDCSRLVEVCYP